MYYNVLSYIFAILSWFMVVIALTSAKETGRSFSFIISSLIFSSFALLFQIAEMHRRVYIGDLSALMDTSYAILFVCSAYLLFTVLLNIVAYKTIKNKK